MNARFLLLPVLGALFPLVAQAFEHPLLRSYGAQPELEAAATTDRMIIRYRDHTLTSSPSTRAMATLTVAGNRRGLRLDFLRRTAGGSDVIKMDRRMSLTQVRELANDLRADDASVEYAEPDRILTPMAIPNDAMYAQQWAYSDVVGGMNLPLAWDQSTGKGVVVAVLDTGVRPHADLAANLLKGYDFIIDTKVSNDGGGRDADPSDPGDGTTAGFCYSGSPASRSSWHGTHVAGSIAAVTNNGSGVAGVAHGAKVLPVRVLGRCGGYTSDIADGIVWAAGGTVKNVPANATPARVINLSLGGSGACDLTTQNAINAARAKGAVVVVAAGNNNADASQFTPASCAGVVTVAATKKSGGKASYSNFGAKVTVAAPGGDGSAGILSTLNAGATAPAADSYVAYMGTSMATPHVSGVVALMLAAKPGLTPDQVSNFLKSSARAFPQSCSSCGAGIVDARAALLAVLGTPAAAPTPTPAPTPATLPVAAVPPTLALKEVESNNTLKTAQNVASAPMVITGAVASTSDLDVFKFSVPAASQVIVALAPNVSSNYDLSVYNSAGQLLITSRQATGRTETIALTNMGNASALLYFQVNRVSGLSGATGTYSLTFKK